MNTFRTTITLLLLSLFSLTVSAQNSQSKKHLVLDDFETNRRLTYQIVTKAITPTTTPLNDQKNNSTHCGLVTYPMGKKNLPDPVEIEVKVNCKNGRQAHCPLVFEEMSQVGISIYCANASTMVEAQFIDEGLAQQTGSDGVVFKKKIAYNQIGKWMTLIYDFSSYAFYESIGLTKLVFKFYPNTKTYPKSDQVYFDDVVLFEGE
ncbi:MAG: hypothetical protein AB8B61_00100 [Cyclobacteriaceae bacterium]